MLIDKLKEKFGAAILESSDALGENMIVIARDNASDIFRALQDDAEFGFEFLMDLTAVDWPERRPRLEVIYQLKSMSKNQRLRVKIRVEVNDAWVPSVYPVWKSADWLERECYDMFGVEFRGHPDLRRILLYDAFVGHPLRKDYPFQKRQPLVPEIDPITKPLRPTK
ncbi:MAG TPA: NADH-quinone oxidoreductase subunit C [Candidatus Binataceae bacterium]|nr:NADH-quinone oxidoreductase subunit C [Candidatus Binataceae bacterium]